MGESLWIIVIAVVMLLIGAVVNTLEVAVKSLSRARVQQLFEEERAGAASLLRVLDSRARYVNLLVLTRTFCSVTGSVLVTSLMLEFFGFGGWSLLGVIVAMTLFAFLILGVVSRSMGRQNPYSVALVAAMPLGALLAVFGPIEKLLIWVGTVITPGGGFRDGPFTTEMELRELVDIAQERGIVHTDERRMIQSVFDLASTTARAVMVPRPEMVWIEKDATADRATRLCVRSGHSRIPVIGAGVDEIVGVVYLKDLVSHQPKELGHTPPPVSELMRPPLFVPDSKPLDSLLDQMQRTRIHIAILIDEYGGVAGLISIEDILEEIVGEIADEYDSEEVAPITELGPGEYRVVSRLSLHELVELYDERMDVEVKFDDEILDEVDTVSGLLAYELGKVPLPGSDITVAGLELIAEGGEDRRGRMRVDTVVVRLRNDPIDAGAISVSASTNTTDVERARDDHQEDNQ